MTFSLGDSIRQNEILTSNINLMWITWFTVHFIIILTSFNQGCHADRPTWRHVRLLIKSDRAPVSDMTVNDMLTSDRVKPELLSPRLLPRWILGACTIPLRGVHVSLRGAHGPMRGAHASRRGTHQRCLLCHDRAKLRHNVTSLSLRRVASSWRIATLLLQCCYSGVN